MCQHASESDDDDEKPPPFVDSSDDEAEPQPRPVHHPQRRQPQAAHIGAIASSVTQDPGGQATAATTPNTAVKGKGTAD